MNEPVLSLAFHIRWLSYVAVLFGLVLRISGARMVFLGIGLPDEIGGAYVPAAPLWLGSAFGWAALLLAAAALAIELRSSDRPIAQQLARLRGGFLSPLAKLLFALAHPAAAGWFYVRYVLN